MKQHTTHGGLRLAITGAFMFLFAILLTAFRPGPQPAPPAPQPTGHPDDEYYKIPDGVAYSGQQMTNKAGLISLSTELGQNYYLVNDSVYNTGFLYAEMKADDYRPTGKPRLPLNIALVLDRSGSMEGDRLAYVKKAADLLIDKLNDKDMLSIIVFESTVGVLQKSVPVTDKAALHQTIDNIVTAGGTNLGGGMMEGFKQVKASYRSGYVNRVLLLSDGEANEGITDLTTLKGIAKKWFTTEGISISTFGAGNDYNENLMTALAETGGGNYYYMKAPDLIPGFLEKEINGMLSVVGQQAQLTFSLPAGISILRVYGGNYEMDKGNMTVAMKDIFANDVKGILIKFKIKKGTNTSLAFGTRLTFTDATNNNTAKAIDNINVMKPISDRTVFLKNFSERVMQQCTLFESNDMLEKAMKAVDDGDYNKARSLSGKGLSYTTTNTARFAPTPETRNQDSVMVSYNKQLKTVEQQNAQDRKVMQKTSKMQNYYIRTKKTEEIVK